MAECTQEEVDKMLPLVSSWRRQYALKYKHLHGQFCALKSFLMLTQLLGYAPEWQYTDMGKPYIAGGPEFSISHCQYAIAVAIADSPVGIDIEHSREISNSLIEYCMNTEEQSSILHSTNKNHAFISLWTQKEAVVKMLGIGITNNIKDVLCLNKSSYELINIAQNEQYICHIALQH